MKIAILQRIRENKFGGLDYYVTEENIKMFEKKGVILMFVNNTLNIEEIVSECAGLYVPGGSDIDPSLYNEELNGSIDLRPNMDEYDLAYIDAFYKAKKPILGICRGHQIINVYFGGSLNQDIKNHSETWHNVKLEKDSFLYDIYKTEVIKVNSLHHQSVKSVAPGFKVVATGEDGTIEALQRDNIYTVQWHPEMYDKDNFINYFFEKIFLEKI